MSDEQNPDFEEEGSFWAPEPEDIRRAMEEGVDEEPQDAAPEEPQPGDDDPTPSEQAERAFFPPPPDEAAGPEEEPPDEAAGPEEEPPEVRRSMDPERLVQVRAHVRSVQRKRRLGQEAPPFTPPEVEPGEGGETPEDVMTMGEDPERWQGAPRQEPWFDRFGQDGPEGPGQAEAGAGRDDGMGFEAAAEKIVQKLEEVKEAVIKAIDDLAADIGAIKDELTSED
jgi:hypothetical protein